MTWVKTKPLKATEFSSHLPWMGMSKSAKQHDVYLPITVQESMGVGPSQPPSEPNSKVTRPQKPEVTAPRPDTKVTVNTGGGGFTRGGGAGRYDHLPDFNHVKSKKNESNTNSNQAVPQEEMDRIFNQVAKARRASLGMWAYALGMRVSEPDGNDSNSSSGRVRNVAIVDVDKEPRKAKNLSATISAILRQIEQGKEVNEYLPSEDVKGYLIKARNALNNPGSGRVIIPSTVTGGIEIWIKHSKVNRKGSPADPTKSVTKVAPDSRDVSSSY